MLKYKDGAGKTIQGRMIAILRTFWSQDPVNTKILLKTLRNFVYEGYIYR